MCEEEIFVGDFGLPHGPVYPLHTRARVKAKARVRVALPRRACRRSPAYRMHRQWTFGTTRFFFTGWEPNVPCRIGARDGAPCPPRLRAPCPPRYVLKTPHLGRQGSANGPASAQRRPEAPRFGQVADWSVFNTPIGSVAQIYSTVPQSSRRRQSFLACTPFCGRGKNAPHVGRARFGNRACVVNAWSAWRALQGCRPHRRQRSPSPARHARF